MALLGVNIDHVATVRNARGGVDPDPIEAALLAEESGADSIVCHLREDRRHIRDNDVIKLLGCVETSVQLEMSLSDEIVAFALDVRPPETMFVPERRQEITTEGGLDVVAHRQRMGVVTRQFQDAGIGVSVFIDAEADQLYAASDIGVEIIELHTGPFSDARSDDERLQRLKELRVAAELARDLGLRVHAGHGLNHLNVPTLLRHVKVEKLNIGHALVARGVFVGIAESVRTMKELISAHAQD